VARRTPLYSVHVAAGARMVEFAGWEMPVQYAGVIEEHLAVRQAAGIFDVSHMGEISVRGRDALSLLQQLTSNDVARLGPGRVQYSALTTPAGAFVDDVLVYRIDEGDYLVVVNAANADKDVAWVVEHARDLDVAVEDVSARWAQIALQGPRAQEILRPVVAGRIEDLRSYAFLKAEVEGVPSIVSRTGYTGEDGFEIYCPAESAEAIWISLRREGESRGMKNAGLGARDTLRLEARMALYGNDIDETTTVLEADLGAIVKLEKGDFLGRDVLKRQQEEGTDRRLVGFHVPGRPVARHGHPILRDGIRVATVTSGSFAPFLKQNVGLAYLPRGMWEPGSSFAVEIRGRQEPAVVVPTPFYKRQR